MRASFDGTMRAPAAMRATVRDILVDQSPELTTDVQIAVSELVSNAVEHARSAGSLAVTVHENGAVLIEVTDAAVGWREHPDEGSLGGRGLGIVDTVSRRWDVSWGPRGKTVWAWFGPTESDVMPLVAASG